MSPGASPASPPAAEQVRVFELAPRCSLTPRTARIFIGIVATTTFSVAGVFAAQGYWPVLPFAGLEIALLAWAVRVSMRFGRQRETIIVSAEWVTVRQTGHAGMQSAVFPRHWARVTLRVPLATLHPSRLMLESGARACEVGRFLTEDERRSLAARLKPLVGNMNETPAL